jgi:hypothetical protein
MMSTEQTGGLFGTDPQGMGETRWVDSPWGSTTLGDLGEVCSGVPTVPLEGSLALPSPLLLLLLEGAPAECKGTPSCGRCWWSDGPFIADQMAAIVFASCHAARESSSSRLGWVSSVGCGRAKNARLFLCGRGGVSKTPVTARDGDRDCRHKRGQAN